MQITFWKFVLLLIYENLIISKISIELIYVHFDNLDLEIFH